MGGRKAAHLPVRGRASHSGLVACADQALLRRAPFDSAMADGGADPRSRVLVTMDAIRLVRTPLDATPRQWGLRIDNHQRRACLRSLDGPEPRPQEMHDESNGINASRLPAIDRLVGSDLHVWPVVLADRDQRPEASQPLRPGDGPPLGKPRPRAVETRGGPMIRQRCRTLP